MAGNIRQGRIMIKIIVLFILSLSCLAQEKLIKPYHIVNFKGREIKFTEKEVNDSIKELTDDVSNMGHLSYKERRKAVNSLIAKVDDSLLNFKPIHLYNDVEKLTLKQKKIFLIFDIMVSFYKREVKTNHMEWKLNCIKVLRRIVNAIMLEDARVVAGTREKEEVDKILSKFFKEFQKEVLTEVVLEGR